MKEKLAYYTIWYRPYPHWGIWKDDLICYPSDIEKIKNKADEIIKIIKHRKLPFEPKRNPQEKPE